MTEDLDALVAGVVQRDNQAFSQLYDLLADSLGAFAFRLVRDRQAAEDAVQQAFIELASAAPGFTGDGRSLQAWLYKSVRFSCLDEFRRRSRRPEVPTERLPEVPFVGSDTEPYSAELASAIASLPYRQQLLLDLRHVHQLSGYEMAEVLGMTRPAAYAALGRAEKNLRKAFTDAVESMSQMASLSVKDGERT
ncbi:MAG: sigma-70 family RNA polymerase sigma factor [Acidimicrobiia bacterium]|nr:sigma-70 family RNA polymerase sigma factor [Acidimicrobiia bacterium]